jgi:hypothetical protein
MGGGNRGGARGDVITIYSDYNAIDGLLIAHSVEMKHAWRQNGWRRYSL